MSDDAAADPAAEDARRLAILRLLRYVRAGDLDGSYIGGQVMVSIPRCSVPGSATIVGVLTDVERQETGMRTAHLALHADGRLCTHRTTVRTPRVAVFLAGLQLFLSPDHPVLVRPVGV